MNYKPHYNGTVHLHDYIITHTHTQNDNVSLLLSSIFNYVGSPTLNKVTVHNIYIYIYYMPITGATTLVVKYYKYASIPYRNYLRE